MVKQKTTDLYLYLARRDKNGVRILAKFKGMSILATRNDASNFNLPTGWSIKISEIIHDSRMLWEPWIESADNFVDLRESLQKRGFRNLPLNAQPEFTASASQTPLVNLSSVPKKTTMLRKN